MAISLKPAASDRRIAPMTPGRALVAMARPSQVALIWVIFASGVLLGLTRPGAHVDVLAFLPFTLVVFASVLATAWPDRTADAATGKATLQVRLRPATLRRVHAAATVGSIVAMVIAAATEALPYALAGSLVVPALVVGMATYTRRTSPLPDVVAMVGLAMVLLLATSAAVLTGSSA